jgi:hypothetical protein
MWPALSIDPVFPVWLITIFVLAAVALSIYSYRQEEQLSRSAFWGLLSLRTGSLILMGFLLTNPKLIIEHQIEEPTQWLLLTDQSESTQFEHGDYAGLSDYQNTLDQVIAQRPTDLAITRFGFGDSVREMNALQSLQPDDQTTQIASVFRSLSQNSDQQYQGALFISDGIYNRGSDPVYALPASSPPIYVIGLGDTTAVQDVYVESINTASVGYTQTTHQIQANIVQRGYKNSQVSVDLIDIHSGQTIDEQSIIFPANKSSQTVSFDIPLQQSGFRSFEIQVSPLEKEWNTKNNLATTVIQVKESEQRLLHLAFEVHPDVKTMRSIWNQDAQLTIYGRTWLGGSRFIEGDLQLNADTLEALVIQGWNRNIPSTIKDQVKKLADELPVLWLLTPNSNLSDFQNIVPNSAIQYPQSIRPYPVTLANDTVAIHSITESLDPPLDVPNPLMAPIRNFTLSPAATPLYWASYNGVTYDSAPIVTVQQMGNQRDASINAYNWYQWQQAGDQPAEFLNKLILRTTDWLLTDPKDQSLSVTPVNAVIMEGETLYLNGIVRNERGDPEPNATVSVDISSERDTGQKNTYSMQHEGDGRYSLNAGRWTPGTYQFKADAILDGEYYATDDGGFTVVPTQLELQNIIRNDQLLRTIAQSTGGHFLTYHSDSLDNIWDLIQQNHSFEPTIRNESSRFVLRRHWLWFLVLMALLGSEWAWRKKSGLI